MHGEIDGKQLPEFGNKGLGCHHCTLDLHGTPKSPSWSLVSSSLAIGDTTLDTVDALTNWNVGDYIVIASSSFDHNEAEMVKITALSG